jgi:hemerythrin-like domain-containing protein
MPDFDKNRRSLFTTGTAGLLLAAGPGLMPVAEAHGGEEDVSAVEDMMREHGVLRRALLVYVESAARLRRNGAGATNPLALNDTAKLFRAFGEDYHERKLEEAYVFPAIRKKGGPAAELIDILVAQHNRGREITDYILNVTGQGSIVGIVL